MIVTPRQNVLTPMTVTDISVPAKSASWTRALTQRIDLAVCVLPKGTNARRDHTTARRMPSALTRPKGQSTSFPCFKTLLA